MFLEIRVTVALLRFFVPVHCIEINVLHGAEGIAERKLTYKYSGRPFRLTGVGDDGHVINEVIA